MKLIISIFTLVTLSTSCNSSKEHMQKITADNNLSGSYIITDLDAAKLKTNTLTINFDDATKKVSGFAGCNSFFGNYTVINNTINFSNIASTKKFCGKDIGTTERQLINTLNKVTSFEIKDNILMLHNDNTTILQALKKKAINKSASIEKSNYDTVIYKALSRNYFEYIEISESNVILSSDKNLQNKSHYLCNTKDWEELSALLSAINHDTFTHLEAPTNKRFYDGAAHSSLSYKIDDTMFTTPSFDEGFPPEILKIVLEKIQNIKQNVSKP